jgi:hypothetical protein
VKRAHQVAAVVCIAFAALAAHPSLTMKLCTPLGPGPGLFPFGLSLLFGALTVLMLLIGLVPGARGSHHGARPAHERALRQPLEIFGGDATILFARPISAAALDQRRRIRGHIGDAGRPGVKAHDARV